MTERTSFYRKLAYLGAIVVLAFPDRLAERAGDHDRSRAASSLSCETSTSSPR